jgi:energy-coupling factor transporter ATP-binding protein EcfA2
MANVNVDAAPAADRSIVDLPLLVLVGVTGVGKSTTLKALAEIGHPFTLLPDRRALTDDLIIAALQGEDGLPSQLVTDRVQRFDYTRRYRERYPGGMAHALTQLRVDAAQTGDPLCFDGLRGQEEVRYAAAHLPLARFLVLDAPDRLRVERLLGRADSFDRIESKPHLSTSTATDLDLPGIDEIFSAEDQCALLSLVESGEVTIEDLRAKLTIVIAERRNYDPAAAIAELQHAAPERTLIVNTALHPPAEVARQIVAFWRGGG